MSDWSTLSKFLQLETYPNFNHQGQTSWLEVCQGNLKMVRFLQGQILSNIRRGQKGSGLRLVCFYDIFSGANRGSFFRVSIFRQFWKFYFAYRTFLGTKSRSGNYLECLSRVQWRVIRRAWRLSLSFTKIYILRFLKIKLENNVKNSSLSSPHSTRNWPRYAPRRCQSQSRKCKPLLIRPSRYVHLALTR